MTSPRARLAGLDRRQLQLTALIAVIVLIAAAGIAFVVQPPGRQVTAYFSTADAVFEDNSVRVLGVEVGSITRVVPEGTRVRVEMRISDDDLKLPADASAAVISPSVVTGRYVQLFPTYSGGPELEDGAVIPIERTAVPLGVDDLTRTATELSRALGPGGVNAQGALSDLLDVSAANLDGNGQAINDSIRNFGDLQGTLADSRDELFGTITELQSFTSTIAANDTEVREFNTRLEDVAGFLADERQDLGAAVQELSIALGDVAAFVRDNREILGSNVDRLTEVTAGLVRQQDALAETIDLAPAGLGNLANTYNASSGTLDTRADINELSLPIQVLACELVRRGAPGGVIPDAELAAVCAQIAQIPLPSPAEVITALQSGQPPPVPGLALPMDPAPVAPAGAGAPAPTGGDR
jgi:phospholipid/cholesterol/gamma-HCH transport system substrate-binding protein